MKTQNLFKSKLPFALIFVFAFFLFNSCKQQATVDAIDEEQKAKEELMIELCYTCINIWVSGNMSLVDEVYSPEIVRHVAGYEDVVGIEAYKEEMKSLHTIFPDMSYSIDEIFVKDDKVYYKYIFSGTNTGPYGDLPPTGKKVKVVVMEIDRIIDGKIVEEWIFYNQLEVMTQLGFTLTPPEDPGK